MLGRAPLAVEGSQQRVGEEHAGEDTGPDNSATALEALFAEAHWEPEFGVSAPGCFEAQLDRIATVVPAVPADQPFFLFVNVAAMHQPNRHYLPGADRDSRASHAAALEYVDRLGADLARYHLFHAIRADLLRTLGRVAEADEADRRALELTSNAAERSLLLTRLS